MAAQRVPLVVYRRGERRVVGDAVINHDGRVIAKITDPDFVEHLSKDLPVHPGEFSFGFPLDVTIKNNNLPF